MKIKFDIEATPQELRTFLGLPDVEPLQQEMMNIIRRNMGAGMEGFDPSILLKPWLPANLQSVDFIQKAFWQGLQNTADIMTPKSENK